MAEAFVNISPYNTIKFARDGNVDNIDYWLHNKRSEPNRRIVPFSQMIITGETVTIQAKLGLDTYTVINSELVDAQGISFPVVGSEVRSTPDLYFYEWEYQFNSEGCFTWHISIQGKLQDDEEESIFDFISEPIAVFGEWNNTVRIDYWNTSNTPEILYDTGIRHFIRLPSFQTSTANESDKTIYNNQGNTSLLYASEQFSDLFRTDPIPQYLARQFELALSRDNLYINEKAFTVSDDGVTVEEFPNTTSRQLECILIYVNAIGLTADFEPPENQETEIEVSDAVIIREATVSTSGAITVPEGYKIITYTVFLTATGSNATVRMGETPAGNEILRDTSLELIKPASGARDYAFSDINQSYTVYISVGGIQNQVRVILGLCRVGE